MVQAKKGSAPRRNAPQKAKKVEPAPADFKVNETQKYKGKCVYFNKSAGYGFIKPETDGVVPEDKVMVHWRSIASDDAWPFLYKNLEVEFQLEKLMKHNGEGCYIKTKNVHLADGKKVNITDELEDKREFIHSKATRFTGEVKFYNAGKGFGYVTMEDGYAGVEHVPKELRVLRHQIRSGDEAPILSQGLKVEFGIVKNLKDNWGCYNVTLPGGDLISRNTVEERKTLGATTYNGEIQFYDRQKGFGYMKPESIDKFPAAVKTSITESEEKAKARLEKRGKDKKAAKMEPLLFFRRGDVSTEGFINRGQKATFQLYTDNRGAGACSVKISA